TRSAACALRCSASKISLARASPSTWAAARRTSSAIRMRRATAFTSRFRRAMVLALTRIPFDLGAVVACAAGLVLDEYLRRLAHLFLLRVGPNRPDELVRQSDASGVPSP